MFSWNASYTIPSLRAIFFPDRDWPMGSSSSAKLSPAQISRAARLATERFHLVSKGHGNANQSPQIANRFLDAPLYPF